MALRIPTQPARRPAFVTLPRADVVGKNIDAQISVQKIGTCSKAAAQLIYRAQQTNPSAANDEALRVLVEQYQLVLDLLGDLGKEARRLEGLPPKPKLTVLEGGEA